MLLAWEILILNLFISFIEIEILLNYNWYYSAMSVYESRSEERDTGGGRWILRYLSLHIFIIVSKKNCACV